MNILVTGATGNVGTEVIKSLCFNNIGLNIIAGLRDPENDKSKFFGFPIMFQKFDFIDVESFEQSLSDCDVLFLIRPPQISQVDQYFKPLITAAINKSITHIVFLSVQGWKKQIHSSPQNRAVNQRK